MATHEDPSPKVGEKTYVVSKPNPGNTPHDVPAGAFPSATNLHSSKFPEADAETVEALQQRSSNMSSTGSAPAHPVLTQRVPR